MDDLAELRKIPGKGQAKSDFITHLSFIKSALTAGHPKKVVWKHLSDKQQGRASYSQFVVYARMLRSFSPRFNASSGSALDRLTG